MSDALDLIDIGANLSHDSFDKDLLTVMEDARTKGVSTIIVTGTSVEESQKAAQLAKQHPDTLYSTAGVHPHHANEFNDDTLSQLANLAKQPQVKAIGETGLDYFRNYSGQKEQEFAFSAQLDLAATLQMPAFLHQRDAHQRFLPILQEHRDKLGNAVVHCFTGTREELYDYLDLDMYIGITGWVCDERRGQHLHELLADIPLDRLMIETDSPYLLPRNIRPKPTSRRNEPAYLGYVLNTIAQCLQISEKSLAKQTTMNARLFFDL